MPRATWFAEQHDANYSCDHGCMHCIVRSVVFQKVLGVCPKPRPTAPCTTNQQASGMATFSLPLQDLAECPINHQIRAKLPLYLTASPEQEVLTS